MNRLHLIKLSLVTLILVSIGCAPAWELTYNSRLTALLSPQKEKRAVGIFRFQDIREEGLNSIGALYGEFGNRNVINSTKSISSYVTDALKEDFRTNGYEVSADPLFSQQVPIQGARDTLSTMKTPAVDYIIVGSVRYFWLDSVLWGISLFMGDKIYIELEVAVIEPDSLKIKWVGSTTHVEGFVPFSQKSSIDKIEEALTKCIENLFTSPGFANAVLS